jgi:tetratricopeptide (TPR) repeat protein
LVAQLQGNYERAEILFQEGLALSREASDPDCLCWALSCLGELAAVQGNYRRARSFYEGGLPIARAAKLHSQASRFLADLGRLSIYAGDLEQAWNLTEEALKTGREIDDKTAAAISLRRLGKIASLMGDHPKARSLFVESLLSARQMANTIDVAASIIYIGLYMLSRGFPKEFARLLGMAEGIAPEALMGEFNHFFKVETGQAVESARAALGEEAYNAAYAAGHEMSLDEAVAYALKALEP